MFPELPEKPLLFPFRMLYLQGRLIKTGKVVGDETVIDMAGTASSVYLLRVLDNEKDIKTFRIIKK